MILAGIVAVAAPLVGRIPLAALAGVLLATAIRMVETDAVRAMARSTRGDALVLVLTAAGTLALDLVRAVLIGLGVSVLLALRAAMRGTRLAPATTDELPTATGTVTYRFDGPLLFAAAHRFRRGLADVQDVTAVDLRLSGLTAVDATGALALKDAVGELRDRGIEVSITGVEHGHRRVLESLGVLPVNPTSNRGLSPVQRALRLPNLSRMTGMDANDVELKKELNATLQARRELGDEYESALVDSFLEKVDQRIDGAVERRVRRRDGRAADGGGPRLARTEGCQRLLGRTLRFRHRLDGPGDPAVRDRRRHRPSPRPAGGLEIAASSASTPSRPPAPTRGSSAAGAAGPPRTASGRADRPGHAWRVGSTMICRRLTCRARLAA